MLKGDKSRTAPFALAPRWAASFTGCEMLPNMGGVSFPQGQICLPEGGKPCAGVLAPAPQRAADSR